MKVKKLEISDNISIKDMFETTVKSNSIWVVYYNIETFWSLSYSHLYTYFYSNKEIPYSASHNNKTLKFEKLIFGEGSNLVDVYEKIISLYLGNLGGYFYKNYYLNSSEFDKFVNIFSLYDIKNLFENNTNNNENLIKNYLNPLKDEHYVGGNYNNSSANKKSFLKELSLLKSLNILEVKLN